ncbi:MAG: hypothetical protein EOP88_17150 [Verrucomicrobiaceae bacterium]|nr:MAG: hypothetical protein EOP88_17150 [Verrucomicrobiaceae bacterium]
MELPETPSTKLAALAVRHLDEVPTEDRAALLDVASSIFATSNKPKQAEQLAVTASLIREAEKAQMSLKDLF